MCKKYLNIAIIDKLLIIIFFNNSLFYHYNTSFKDKSDETFSIVSPSSSCIF